MDKLRPLIRPTGAFFAAAGLLLGACSDDAPKSENKPTVGAAVCEPTITQEVGPAGSSYISYLENSEGRAYRFSKLSNVGGKGITGVQIAIVDYVDGKELISGGESIDPENLDAQLEEQDGTKSISFELENPGEPTPKVGITRCTVEGQG